MPWALLIIMSRFARSNNVCLSIIDCHLLATDWSLGRLLVRKVIECYGNDLLEFLGSSMGSESHLQLQSGNSVPKGNLLRSKVVNVVDCQILILDVSI